MSQHYWWQISNTQNTTALNSTWKLREQPEPEPEPEPEPAPDPNEPEPDSELLPREIVHREVSFELEAEGDGRTLYTRIVPYDVPTKVADPPHWEPYMESWATGVFDKQLRAANRVDVLLNFEHEKGIGGIVGRGVELRSQRDGLHGTFRILSNPDGDKTLELVREEVLTGMSLEAIALKSVKEGDTVVRKEARLRNVAICRNPAFPGAMVLAVRSESDEPDEPAPEPDPEDDSELQIVSPKIEVPELVVRDDVSEILAKVGYESLLKRAITRRPWDGSPARFSDEQYARSCLIDRGGDVPPKERCSLPVLEPNGDLNVNGMHAAAGRLNQVGVPGSMKAMAARKLIRYYRQAGEEPPEALLNIGGR